MILVIYLGVSISSCIMGKSGFDEDEDHLVQRLDSISQWLKEISSSNKLFSGENPSVCCAFCTEALGDTFGHDSLRDTFILNDSTSFSLDMKLLQELSSVLLIDPKIFQPVRSSKLIIKCVWHHY